MEEKLFKICKKYTPSKENNAIISEGYIPYIPKDWNKILILAESQNLSHKNNEYVNWLKSLVASERMDRLKMHKNGIGIQPWDDGSLKLAVESALNKKAENTAVSNAVLWSQRTNTGANINPSNSLTILSIQIWKDFLPILQPNIVMTAGKKAEHVIENTNWTGKHIKLRLPAKTAMSRVSGMFKVEDLLVRYPEVKRVTIKNPAWIKEYKENKIFFACHAVSRIKENLTRQST